MEPSALLRFAAIELDPERRTVFIASDEVRLTATEFEILEALMRSPRRVFTRSHLIDIAFGPDFDGLERTVDAHVGNLRRKLESLASGSAFVQTVKGVGYRLASDECS